MTPSSAAAAVADRRPPVVTAQGLGWASPEAFWEERVQRAAHPLAYPALRSARDRPVVRVPRIGVVVSDAELAREVLLDLDHFSKVGPGAPSDLWTPVLGPSVLLNMEGAEHSALRRALGPLGDWSIKAVIADGVDIIDTGADAATLGGDTTVRVIMSDKTTEITGSVRDSRGQPATDYVLVLLPQQPAEGVAAMRYTRRARPDQSGAFTLRGLPPGRYVAAALESLDATGEWDPEVQARIRTRGERFTLAEGQTTALALELR